MASDDIIRGTHIYSTATNVKMAQHSASQFYEKTEHARNYAIVVMHKETGGSCEKCLHKLRSKNGMLRCIPKNKRVTSYNICHLFKDLNEQNHKQTLQAA